MAESFIVLDEQQLAMMWPYAEDIRDRCPIKGLTATDAECVARNAAVQELLDSWYEEMPGAGPSATERTWYSVLFADRTVAGQWNTDPNEAALDLMIWFGKPALLLADDLAHTYRDEWKLAVGDARVDLATGDLVPSGGLLDLLDHQSEDQ